MSLIINFRQCVQMTHTSIVNISLQTLLLYNNNITIILSSVMVNKYQSDNMCGIPDCKTYCKNVSPEYTSYYPCKQGSSYVCMCSNSPLKNACS